MTVDPYSFCVGAFALAILWGLANLGLMHCPFCNELAWVSQHRRCRKAYLFMREPAKKDWRPLPKGNYLDHYPDSEVE